MLIKHHINKNEYCLSRSGHWIRNFTKPAVKPIDINDITPLEDMKLIVDNEFKNSIKRYQTMENTFHEKAIILGDGYAFEESVRAIEELSADVIVIGVNKTFSRWKSPRTLNYYVVNNPYQDCLYYYPQVITSWPRCIASSRTYPHFLEVYKGSLSIYSPICGEVYSGPYNDSDFFIDDYRNSICAAIGLCYKFKVKKLMLMSTLEMYQEERSGTIPAKNGLWTYPQQKIANDLIDANLYWMQKAKIDVGYTNSGLDYEFATYINVADLKRFFNDGQKR
jgi:hypothetical protein